MFLQWPSNVLFEATRLAIGGKRVMARGSHIEKPQSPELQGFGEGDKFLSFLLVGSNSGVSGKTQNLLRQFLWFRRWPLKYKDFLQLNMYVGFHVPPQCPSDFSETTLGVGFENTKAGVLELVNEVDSKTGSSIVPIHWIVLDFSRVLRYTVFRKSACSLLSSLLSFWPGGQFGRGSGKTLIDTSRCDGIGRRSGFKIRRWQHRGGSSPPTGTN